MKRWGGLICASITLALAGCGNNETEEPAGAAGATRAAQTEPAGISTTTFVRDMRHSLAAVDEFLGAFARCLQTQGCALDERSNALGRIDATIRSATNMAGLAADPCGATFATVTDTLHRQKRAVVALQQSAGDAGRVRVAMRRVDAASDRLAANVDRVNEAC